MRRFVLIVTAAAAVTTVAGCTNDSDGGGGAPSAAATVTTTDTVSSANPPTGSGVPASSTAPATGATTGGGSSGSASGPGLCTPTVMTFTVSANEGAAGSTYFSVHATNASQQSCVTTGFPGIAFLDGAGTQILQADRDDPDQSKTIVVAPGQQVTAQVRAASAGNGSQTCPSSPAFLFTLPDNTDSTKLTHTTPACTVTVSAFVAGNGN